MTWSQFLPIEPCAKARPRVTRRGTYMPAGYMKWRRRFCAMVVPPARPMAGSLSVTVMVFTKSGHMRPDLDNVGAGVLDALQDAKVITNDRNAVRLTFILDKCKEAGIHITAEEYGP